MSDVPKLPTGEPCTTEGRRKRHYARHLGWRRTGPNALPGRAGPTLCGEDAYDQERIDARAARYGGRAPIIDRLPECQKCAKALARSREVSGD